jgi:4-hydroxy-3-methylbut-2-enyl diphosphate reductase
MSGLLIAVPLRLEAWAISAGRPPARIRRTGMGERRSRAAVPVLLEDPAAALLVMGFGGGLTAESRVGEIVVADVVRAEHGHEQKGRPEQPGEREPEIACRGAGELARAIEATGLPVRHGPVVSVRKIAVGDARAALGESGALAVDMESAWLAQAARGRPFAVVRVLSDTPTQELFHPRGVIGIARACAMLRNVAAALHDWVPGE